MPVAVAVVVVVAIVGSAARARACVPMMMLGVHVNQSMPTKLKCNAIITVCCKRREKNEFWLCFLFSCRGAHRAGIARDAQQGHTGGDRTSEILCRRASARQKKCTKIKRRRQKVSDVSDIDQIMKVFLARSIPIDGKEKSPLRTVCVCVCASSLLAPNN